MTEYISLLLKTARMLIGSIFASDLNITTTQIWKTLEYGQIFVIMEIIAVNSQKIYY